MDTLSFVIDGSEVSAAVGEMNSTFNPNQVISTFNDLGVDIAFMQGNNQVFIIAPSHFDEVGSILEDANIAVKMRLNESILAVRSDAASMGEIFNAFINAD